VREPLGEEETVAKRISGIVLALILAVPYLAEAECAWVVWSNYQTVTEFRPQADGSQKVMTDVSNRWEFERAFPSYKDCNWWVGELMKDLKKNPSVGDGLWFPRCLPDTMDPRGPKGGVR